MARNHFEFDVGDGHFRCRKMNAIAQFEVLAKISPIIPKLIPMASQVGRLIAAAGGTTVAEKMQAALATAMAQPEILQPLCDALAHLPGDDFRIVLSHCMAVVSRQHQEHWSPVWIESKQMFSSDELEDDLMSCLKICWHVIAHSLANFSLGLPTGQQTKPATAAPG